MLKRSQRFDVNPVLTRISAIISFIFVCSLVKIVLLPWMKVDPGCGFIAIRVRVFL